MPDTFWMNLAGILGGAALVITAVSSLINTWFAVHNGRAIATIDRKVDDGAKEVQRAISDIAKTAVASATTRTVRSTDPKGAS